MSKPCLRCMSTLGDCSPDNGGRMCLAQSQCLACIFWGGTVAFGPGSYCEQVREAPTGDCARRLEAPEPLPARDGHLSAIQSRVWAWCSTVFADRPGWEDKRQRVHRFIEEAVELAQACEVPQHEVERLVGYVYGRPVGEPSQELGGTVITLAALAEALGLSAEDAALTELERVERPEVMEKVRRKQVGKDALFAEESAPLTGIAAHVRAAARPTTGIVAAALSAQHGARRLCDACRGLGGVVGMVCTACSGSGWSP